MYLVPTTATVNVDQNTRSALDCVHVKYCGIEYHDYFRVTSSLMNDDDSDVPSTASGKPLSQTANLY